LCGFEPPYQIVPDGIRLTHFIKVPRHSAGAGELLLLLRRK